LIIWTVIHLECMYILICKFLKILESSCIIALFPELLVKFFPKKYLYFVIVEGLYSEYMPLKVYTYFNARG
jgi:hypothetical protein